MGSRTWILVGLVGALVTPGARAQVPRRDGPQSIANATIAGDQDQVATAVDAAGDFVIVWRADGQDGAGSAIVGRRFSGRSGQPLGDEFLVNETRAGDQRNPTIAMADDGRFAVAWEGPDPNGHVAIFGSLRQPDGTPIVGEFPVSTPNGEDQVEPAAAIQANGDFLVAWRTRGLLGVLLPRILGRVFDPGAVGGQVFQINRLALTLLARPSVAADRRTGGWFTTWQRSGVGSFLNAIYYLPLPPDGPPLPGLIEVVLNLLTPGLHRNSVVAANRLGEAVAVWEAPDGSGSGIFSREILDGVPVGSEQAVNLLTPGDQRNPAVVLGDDGDLVAVWISDRSSSSPLGSPIVVQGRKKSNHTQGNIPAPDDEFQVSTSGDAPAEPWIASEPRGNFVVAWHAEGVDDPSDPTGRGALFQRFSDPVFGDDFETGDARRWSQVVP
jgi:hypothetical protein